MLTVDSIPAALRTLTRDGWLLFLTRFVRLFAYGSLSVVLVFYLIGLGLSASQTGLLLTLTLVGDTVVSLYLTTRADRIGRRRMLIIGAILMAAAGLAFAFTSNFLLLILAGTIGVISPSGNEVGPFLSIEQAALSHVVPARTRTEVFAWYTLAGSLATAIGALCGGTLTHALQKTVMRPVVSYRTVVILYAALGAMLAFVFTRLSSAAEVSAPGVESGGAELRCLLVLPAFRCRPWNTRRNFLLGEYLCWDFGTTGVPASFPPRTHQDHGRHTPPLEHSADSCTADAESFSGCPGSAGAFQYQSNGCTH